MQDYDLFLKKFETKKTTDDCYTPENVYSAVADYVCETYNVDKTQFIRPFYPGGDYEHYEYPNNCVVVDNPPFSILSSIINYYIQNKIRFFLFAPALTLFSKAATRCCCIAIGATITYENGAKVSTSFVTNLESGVVAKSCPKLYDAVTKANEANIRKVIRKLPKYVYPDNVVTATFLNQLSKQGIEYSVAMAEYVVIGALDEQRRAKKAIFGQALLVSEKAAEEKAAKAEAEKAKDNKIIWNLSDREKELISSLP